MKKLAEMSKAKKSSHHKEMLNSVLPNIIIKNLNKDDDLELDIEWLLLIQQAKDLGLTVEEIKHFFRTIQETNLEIH